MGILGPTLTRQGEKMRPDLGFGKSICSPERLPFQLLRECDQVEETAQPGCEVEEGGTVLDLVEEEQEGVENEMIGSQRPGQVTFLCVIPHPLIYIQTEKGFVYRDKALPKGWHVQVMISGMEWMSKIHNQPT